MMFDEAFIFDHKFFPTEEPYMHMCVKYIDFWEPILYSRWLLKEICYIVTPETVSDLQKRGVDLDFAIKYYKDVVEEFGVFIEVRKNYDGPIVMPKRTFAINRASEHIHLNSEGIALSFYQSRIKSIFRRLKKVIRG